MNASEGCYTPLLAWIVSLVLSQNIRVLQVEVLWKALAVAGIVVIIIILLV